MKKLFLYVLFLGCLSSCVTTKQMTYFQGEPLDKMSIYKLNNEPYRLQVNDVLYVDIKAGNSKIVSLFKNEESNQTTSNRSEGLYYTGYTVSRHGSIRIPYIGDLNVLGYTEIEVREKIEIELAKFLKNPDLVFVTVKLAGIRFVVTGEVGSPGTINLTQNQVSVIDAIANAGEISQLGNRKNVILIRKTLDGVKKYNLDFTNINLFESENFYIQPNDIIYVPPLKQKSWGTGTTGLQTFSTVITVLSFLISSVLLVKSL